MEEKVEEEKGGAAITVGVAGCTEPPTPTLAAERGITVGRCSDRARTACTCPCQPSILTKTGGRSRPGERSKIGW